MKNMKKGIVWLLTAALVLGLSACGDTVDGGETATQPSAGAETEASADQDHSALVKDAYEATVILEDNTYRFQVPEIQLDTSAARAVNQAIREIFDKQVEKTQKETNIFKVECYSISYTWRVYEEILSLVIEAAYAPNSMSYTRYIVYNYDLRVDKLMPDDQLVAFYGLDQDAYMALLQDALGNLFYGMYGGAFYSGESSSYDFAQEQLEKTISTANLHKAQPFFNEEGHLSVVASIYSLGGADFYDWQVDLETYPTYDDYTPPQP